MQYAFFKSLNLYTFFAKYIVALSMLEREIMKRSNVLMLVVENTGI